ncbi:MAG: isocitrate/isopropylmalate dehydrogenase family protein [Ignisphaera sp.]|uniref:Isocitrate/isopropylmalate dehydrogenase family protein n=2 Tax=Ignisphaera aggregans TaxID=334771 RepID=A0A832AUM6_9CREN
MAKRYKIGVIRGDGIGPEIIDSTLEVLQHLNPGIDFVEISAGYEYYKKTGKAVEDTFFDTIRNLDAVLKGPLYTPPHDPNFKSVNILIRKELDLYANIRPFKSFRGVSQKVFNIVIFRENTEGEYVGIEGMFNNIAISLRIISEKGSRRICDLAFRYAKLLGFKKVSVVHKANILKVSDGLFRRIFFDVAKNYPDIAANEIIVDTAAYMLVKNPEDLQILVTPNLYGDILSDLVGGLMGSLGLCGSALIGDTIGVFEPIHGVAMDIASKGIANPVGAMMAAKMMLEYLAQRYSDSTLIEKTRALENSIYTVIEDKKIWTPDLGGNYKTRDVAKAVTEELNKILYASLR